MSLASLASLLPALFLVAVAPGARALDLESASTRIAERTNDFRTSNELGALARNGALGQAAREFAGHMARTGEFAHDADGRQPAERASAAGYEYCIVAENIGYHYRAPDFGSPDELAAAFVEGWKNSPGHRQNMLRGPLTEIGVGIEQDSRGGYYGVQLFGRPRAAAIRFEIVNLSGERVMYESAGRAFSLRPRQGRTHTLCEPAELAITRESGETFRAEVEHGVRYRVRKDSVDTVEGGGG